VRTFPDALILQQFENPANPEIHRARRPRRSGATPAGKVDVVISGVGTGGTLTGRRLGAEVAQARTAMVAVEPEDSAVLSGGRPVRTRSRASAPASSRHSRHLADRRGRLHRQRHGVQARAQKVARLEGIPVGISSGAALAAALEVGSRPDMAGKTIVTILPDFAERYLSTALFEGLTEGRGFKERSMELSEEQFRRYARHLILDEVGEEGQEKLLGSRVLVVGAGGLGSPLLMYLAAAGVGTIGIVDDDRVDITNLQRQIVHATGRVGDLKVDSAEETLARLNDDAKIETHAFRLGPDNAAALIGRYDLVADGSDNFGTRYLLTDLCARLEKPLVAAALSPFEGQLSTFRPYLGDGHPCYRCLFREPPPPDMVPRCEEAGILGAVAGVLGTLQAVEVLKELLGLGESLDGTLLIYDALRARFHRIRIGKDPDCPTCGAAALAARA
jgi:molybdopterin-synthase adenylyltransferase